MPIFEYQCKACKLIQEELVRPSEIDSYRPACIACHAESERVLSATPGFVIGGASNRCGLHGKKRNDRS